MQLKGSIAMLDGSKRFNLTVDVDTGDDDTGGDIYVTNIGPSCLMIPRDRFDIGYLGLSYRAIEELREKNVKTLGDVIGRSGWNIKKEFSPRVMAELELAITELQKIALVVGQEKDLPVASKDSSFKGFDPDDVFGEKVKKPAKQKKIVYEQPEEFFGSGHTTPQEAVKQELQGVDTNSTMVVIPDDTPVEKLGFNLRPASMTRLKSVFGVSTVADLAKKSSKDLKEAFSGPTVSRISACMKQAGHSLRQEHGSGKPPKKQPDASASLKN